MHSRKALKAVLCVFGLSLAATSAFSQKTTLTGFIDAQGGQHVFYLDKNSNLNQLIFLGGKAWGSQNLTGTFGGSLPAANTALTGFVDASGGQHVFYVDANNNVNQMYTPGPGNGETWYPQNLTGVFGGNAANPTALTSFYDPTDGSEHVFYLGLSVTTTTPSPVSVNQIFFWPSTNTWYPQDLSDTYGGNAAQSTSQITSYLDNVGGEHVVFQSDNGDINQLFYPGSGLSWIAQDLTASYGGNTPSSPTGLSSYIDAVGGQHVVYVDAKGNVDQLAYITGAGWLFQNVTILASGAASGGSNVATYVDSVGGQHLVFLDAAGNVSQLFNPTPGSILWYYQNLSGTYSGVAAGTLSSLAPFPSTQSDSVFVGGDEHIAYVDVNENVDQLFYPSNGTTWFWQNLTSYAGSIPALFPE
ncbi:MAG: hypothetical protein JO319_08960 [Acidobacteriaceae bacterium]|nr:hypothetical protein [Acidobacteriaceae bacterium]